MNAPTAPPSLEAIVDDVLRLVTRGRGAAASRGEGWDSHQIVQIIFAVEDAYGFQMTGAEMESVADLPSLAAIVDRRRGK